MNADILIKMVLAEGVKHVIIPNYKEEPDSAVPPFPTDPKIDARARKLYPFQREPGHKAPKTRDENDKMYGFGRSRNHHLNAVQRHILPSLGTMMQQIRPLDFYGPNHPADSYTQLSKDMEDRRSKISDQDREIWNEYNRHLTDLAHHIHRTIMKRRGKVRAHGGSTSGIETHDDGWQRQAVANMHHDVLDHRGLGTDISHFGELITAFTNPDIQYSFEKATEHSSLQHGDRHLANHSVEQLRARLDSFYRRKEGNMTGPVGRAVVPKESHQRILQASKQISIPKGWKTIARNKKSKP